MEEIYHLHSSKKLCEKGLFQNEDGVVTSKISQEEFYTRKSEEFVEETFGGFFEDMGYPDVEYHIVDGRMPCAIAVITKKNATVLIKQKAD